MFSTAVDLAAYFDRIEYAGPPVPSRQTLDAVLEAHTQTIPFENLNPLAGWPVRLDPASLQQKLVHDRRGGYCFEHNLLLGHVLTAMGFSVTGLSARVRWNTPPEVVRPRTHMLLRIDMPDGTPLVVDGGFGGPGLTSSLLLQPDSTQATPHDRYRLTSEGRLLRLDVDLPGGWIPLYAFELDACPMADYEMGNWFVSTHPESMFVTSLVVALAGPGRRLTLRNREFTMRGADGTTARTVLPDVSAVRAVLSDSFGLRVPEVAAIDAAIDRALAADAPPAQPLDVR